MSNVIKIGSGSKAADDLPAWLDKELWQDYCAHREAVAAAHRGKRYPWGAGQRKYALRSLERLIVESVAQGWKPDEAQAAIVEQTIANGWIGFFQLRR